MTVLNATREQGTDPGGADEFITGKAADRVGAVAHPAAFIADLKIRVIVFRVRDPDQCPVGVQIRQVFRSLIRVLWRIALFAGLAVLVPQALGRHAGLLEMVVGLVQVRGHGIDIIIEPLQAQ